MINVDNSKIKILVTRGDKVLFDGSMLSTYMDNNRFDILSATIHRMTQEVLLASNKLDLVKTFNIEIAQ